MCGQCMLTAAAATATATGLRGWLAAHSYRWLTPARLRRITLALVIIAILVSGTMSGTGS